YPGGTRRLPRFVDLGGDGTAARRESEQPLYAGYARSGPAGASPTFVPSGPRTAAEACGRRVFIALAICMDRECERPAFRDHPDCKRVLELKRQREQN
ncbi:MAG TPA: hypothetical protein VJO99_00705, partial [Burkholderiaceae bacterium]|nr:hypothetical protein [Burkholderiaceae bacterium]